MTWGETPRNLVNETASVFRPHVHWIVRCPRLSKRGAENDKQMPTAKQRIHLHNEKAKRLLRLAKRYFEIGNVKLAEARERQAEKSFRRAQFWYNRRWFKKDI